VYGKYSSDTIIAIPLRIHPKKPPSIVMDPDFYGKMTRSYWPCEVYLTALDHPAPAGENLRKLYFTLSYETCASFSS
jgi:hypothetical protein